MHCLHNGPLLVVLFQARNGISKFSGNHADVSKICERYTLEMHNKGDLVHMHDTCS